MRHDGRDTHETQSVYDWTVDDVPRQVHIRHPTRNKLDGIGGDTQEGNNVRVGQVFPHSGYLEEGLGIFRAQI